VLELGAELLLRLVRAQSRPPQQLAEEQRDDHADRQARLAEDTQ